MSESVYVSDIVDKIIYYNDADETQGLFQCGVY